MSLPEILSVVVLGLVGGGGALAYFKFKPGQREHLDITVAEATLNVAHGTLKLVTSELEDQFTRMAAEQKAMREEYAKYRADTDSRLSELSAELRSKRAEVLVLKRELETYRSENERLKARVADLERG